MPVRYPGPEKTAPDVYPLAPAVTIVRQPVMDLQFPFGCGEQFAVLQMDTMPVMSRDPLTIPNVPGAFPSTTLEYADMGVAPANAAGARWSGIGGRDWTVYVDGVALTTFSLYDGTPGPFGIQIPAPGGGWGAGPYTVWISATYEDRPEFRDFYMNTATQGIIAFGPSNLLCTAAFYPSPSWDTLGYWDPWVSAHHNVADTNGPADRHGNYLGLAGLWGTDVPQQRLRAPILMCVFIGFPDFSAFSSNLIDLVETEVFPAETYLVETTHQILTGCTTPLSGYPIFDQTNAHKVHH